MRAVVLYKFSGEIQKNVPLSGLCTFRTGGTASTVYYPNDAESLLRLFSAEPFSVPIGNGSNVLFTDRELSLPLICTKNLRAIRKQGDLVFCECGVFLPELAKFCLDHGLSGAEFLCGIPGTVGGGVAMNAGAFGTSVSDVLVFVRTANGTVYARDCGFSYRHSVFLDQRQWVIEACFRFVPDERERILSRMKKYIGIRKTTQPLTYPSAGSVFRAQGGIPAWTVIDAIGMRGFCVGRAQVSEKHANFIVNLGGATSEDVLSLISLMKARAFSERKVVLSEEIRYIGDFYDSDC